MELEPVPGGAPEHPPMWHALTAGGSAAVASRLFTYPPDTVKVRLQLQGDGGGPPPYRSTAHAFASIMRSEGVPGFYRGFGAILLTVVPASAAYFSGYEWGRRLAPPGWGAAGDAVTACLAQTVAGFAYCPIDIVKQRVQAGGMAGGPGATTAAAAAAEVWRRQGAAGFFRGYWAMNALWLPWNLVYLSAYEACKRRVYRARLAALGWPADAAAAAAAAGRPPPGAPPMQQALPLWAFPVCSSACSALAGVVTHPIDVVKTRLQVLSAADREGRRFSARAVAGALWRAEGAAGFARGMAARVGTLSMGSAISWSVYEFVKRHLGAERPGGGAEL